MRLGDFSHTPAVTSPPGRPIVEIAGIMRDLDVGSVIVVDDAGRVGGIVTDRDLAVRGLAAGLDPTTPVEAVMSASVVTAGPDTDVFEAAEALSVAGCRRLPIVDDAGHPIGIVTVDNLSIMANEQMNRLVEVIASETRPDGGASLRAG
jgi:CBS domain-containing protein